MPDKRILVVDDEPDVVNICVERLEEEGFEVRGVTDGAQAIDLYKAERFDLVLADLKMPNIDGIEVLKAIVEYDPEALVVMMTAFGTVDTAVEALKSGAQEFITKPFKIGAVAAKLCTLVEQRTGRAVRGNLRDLGLTSIISVNCNEMTQAQLLIRRPGQQAAIYFENGTIVHAILDGREGEEVIYELLSWEDGSFELEPGVPPPKRTIGADWRGLLLEGMRRIDEGMPGSELEWDEAETQEEKTWDRVARALKSLEGIEGAVICSQGGELLGQATSADSVGEAMLTAFVRHQADTIGTLLNAGQLRQVVVTGAKRGTMILAHERNYVGLSLARRTSAESVAPAAQIVLRRYQ